MSFKDEFMEKFREVPGTRKLLIEDCLDEILLDEEDGLVIARFHAPEKRGYLYYAWNRTSQFRRLDNLEGSFWRYDTKQNTRTYHPNTDDIKVPPEGVILLSCAPSSPVIDSIYLDGDPIEPFPSRGDLWMSTWADDDMLYSGWGDGYGLTRKEEWIDCGIARFSGMLPDIEGEERRIHAPTENPDVDDKPSSLIYIDDRLYGQFHSTLGDAWIGYLACSEDYGKTWQRIGFYHEWEKPGDNASPWTRDRNSCFRCLFFINMGKNYSLNADGYVYALGIGKEWDWPGPVYLTRVPKGDILTYSAYEYFTGIENDNPQWSGDQFDAVPLDGVTSSDQGSVMYHPTLERYLFLTARELYDAPAPWGPWTMAGVWANEQLPEIWRGGYQPGIISKDTGPDYFWFTISGQNDKPLITYNLNLGKMRMKLKNGE